MSHSILHFVGYAYVDDTDQVENLKITGESTSDIIIRMQKAVDTWEASIKTTGGAIRPKKCYWYVVDFKWKDSKWEYKTTDDLPATLTVKDTDGSRHPIRRLDIKDKYKDSKVSLGVTCEPFGQMTNQVESMLEKSKRWASKIEAGHLPRALVDLALRLTLWKTLCYPLPATTLSIEQCHTIMKPALTAALPKMGVNRHFPRALVHSPMCFHGLGLRHLHTQQAVYHLRDIINHQLSHTPVSIQHRGAFELLYLNIGISGDFLSLKNFAIMPDQPSTIATCVWEFLVNNAITLQTSIDAPLLRKNDSFLMDKIYLAKESPDRIRIFNRCRMYLKILTVAELATGDGKKIRQSVIEGKNLASARDIKWPNQGRPSKKEWSTWESMLRLHFCSSFTNLKVRLGDWVTQLREQWWYSPLEDSLYYGPLDNECLQRWIPKNRKCHGSNRVFVPSKSFSPPNDLQTAIVESRGALAWFSGSAPSISLDLPQNNTSQFSKMWSLLPPGIKWPLEHCKGWENLDDLHLAYTLLYW